MRTSKMTNDEIVTGLLNDVKKSGLVLFVGAGVSIPLPAGAPSWNSLKREILKAFHEKLFSKNWPINAYLSEAKDRVTTSNVRPETFLFLLTQHSSGLFVNGLIESINLSHPNPNHYLISNLLNKGVVKKIVTTNFDQYIEKCLDGNYELAVNEDEIGYCLENLGSPIIFKPHGCLSQPNSMKYRLDQIQKLSETKAALLESVLLQAPTLFVGYSGNDEDIFPVLSKLIQKSKFNSYVCSFPSSPDDEPIKNLIDEPNCHLFLDNPTNVLCKITQELVVMDPNIAEIIQKCNDGVYTSHAWVSTLSNRAITLEFDKIAIFLADLLLYSGNKNDAYRFANLAEDIVVDSKLSSEPKESLRRIATIQRRIAGGKREFATAGYALPEIQLESLNEPSPDIGNNLELAHSFLRNDELSKARDYIGIVEVQLMRNGYLPLEEIDINTPAILQTYFWYCAIYKAKVGEAKNSEFFFQVAIVISEKKGDIITSARIYLDYGLAKCSQREWEQAQIIWLKSISLAKQANDWVTAGKAALDRGILLGISDNPHLSRAQFEEAKKLLSLTNDIKLQEKVEYLSGLSRDQLIPIALLLSMKVDSAKDGP